MYRLLLVEDRPDISLPTRIWLISCGFDVTLAESAAEALKSVEAASFDVILCDISLPDMNGVELMRLIRVTRKTPAISYSALARLPASEAELNQLFAARIPKPSDPDFMLATIRRVLASTFTAV